MIGLPRHRAHSAVWFNFVAVLAVGLLLDLSAAYASSACQTAGLDAERKLSLPPGFLLAIGQVESGRRDDVTGRIAPWPWTINANGTGQVFETLPEAVLAVRGLLARGVASIDVGCFQVNLVHHPKAFASLEEAFDPQANAAYAARFLSDLRIRTGSWEQAIASYHSAAPERGNAYRDRVLAALNNPVAASVLTLRTVGPTVVWRPAHAAGRMQISTPSVGGMAPSVILIRSASK